MAARRQTTTRKKATSRRSARGSTARKKPVRRKAARGSARRKASRGRRAPGSAARKKAGGKPGRGRIVRSRPVKTASGVTARRKVSGGRRVSGIAAPRKASGATEPTRRPRPQAAGAWPALETLWDSAITIAVLPSVVYHWVVRSA